MCVCVCVCVRARAQEPRSIVTSCVPQLMPHNFYIMCAWTRAARVNNVMSARTKKNMPLTAAYTEHESALSETCACSWIVICATNTLIRCSLHLLINNYIFLYLSVLQSSDILDSILVMAFKLGTTEDMYMAYSCSFRWPWYKVTVGR